MKDHAVIPSTAQGLARIVVVVKRNSESLIWALGAQLIFVGCDFQSKARGFFSLPRTKDLEMMEKLSSYGR